LICDKLRDATRAFALPEDLSKEGQRKLAVHQSRYTMERENELHANALGNSTAPDTKSVAGSAAGDVDLFDSVTPETPLTPPVVTPPYAENFPAQSAAPLPLPPVTTQPPAPKEDLGDGIELF
jgi:hypothetical protein